MEILNVLAMAVGLGMDAMSVCAAVGVRWHGARQKFRLAWHMGLFQFLMPILGFLLGSQLAGMLKAVGTYFAAALVFAVGAKMFYEAVRSHPGAAAEGAQHALEHGPDERGRDPTRGWSLMVLSLATSLDALVVGFALALKGATNIWWPSVAIGLTAGGMSLAGVAIGRRVGERLGKYAELAGALVLIGLAVSFLL